MVENNGIISSVVTTAQIVLQNADLMLLTKHATEIDGSLKITCSFFNKCKKEWLNEEKETSLTHFFFLPSTTGREKNKISPSQIFALTLSIYDTLGHTQVKY